MQPVYVQKASIISALSSKHNWNISQNPDPLHVSNSSHMIRIHGIYIDKSDIIEIRDYIQQAQIACTTKIQLLSLSNIYMHMQSESCLLHALDLSAIIC